MEHCSGLQVRRETGQVKLLELAMIEAGMFIASPRPQLVDGFDGFGCAFSGHVLVFENQMALMLNT